jgi:hypothetical protein
MAKVERLAVNKQRSHRPLAQRFNLNKLQEAQGKEKYHEVTNRFATLEDLDVTLEKFCMGVKLGL